MGSQPQIQAAWVKVNKALLKVALHRCKKVTLDLDATEIVAHKAGARWTYNKNKGFMPMIGQVAAVDFRHGNVPPAKDNLAFIQQCQQSLPEDCTVKALRIDAASYQTKVIAYCDKPGIEYAIRAKTSAALRAQIESANASDWQPLLDKKARRSVETVQKTLAKPCYMWKTLAGLAVLLGSCFRRNDECWVSCTVSWSGYLPHQLLHRCV